MKRKIDTLLEEWKNKERRLPLIINGARQVGKTYAINKFGSENYDQTVYLNFELNPELKEIFSLNLEPYRLIQQIELFFERNITPENTLIFFDEVQACEQALTSLKYFSELAPEYDIIAAGSLLGVAIDRSNFSFPVGKVEFLRMNPLDFEEFLWASGKNLLANEIRVNFNTNTPLLQHNIALEMYENYLIVGGMPAVVMEFINSNSLLEVAVLQEQILNGYLADMAKYANNLLATRIRGTLNSIPAQLAKDNKKFQFKIVAKGGTLAMFEDAINWLNMAGMVMKSTLVEHPSSPLKAASDLTTFKLYLMDVGLLVQMSEIPKYNLTSSGLENNTFIGAITENYIAQELNALGCDLYYWASLNTAELDFVVQIQEKIVPIEVKAGIHTQSKSWSVYNNRYQAPYLIRFSKKNFGWENNIKSIPLYATFCLDTLF